MIDRRFIDFSLIVQGVADEPSDDFVKGTQYIVGEMPLGDFENAEPGQIARYDGEKWNFISPKEAGLEVINAETGELLQFDGVIWNVVATLSGGGSGGQSLLVVDDLAIVVSSSEERPNDYIFNYCIVDNGLNSPAGYGYYAHGNSYDLMYYYSGRYGDLPVNSVLAGDNGKYYTFKPTIDDYNHYLIEPSEIAAGTFVLNKACNMLYQFNGTSLELVGGNTIGVNYAGLSDISSKQSNADYWKHFGEVELNLYGNDCYLRSPDWNYDGWYSSHIATLKAGDLFASTNHCMLYYAVDENKCVPVSFLKKGTVIFSDFDKRTYVSNGTTLEKVKKNELITVKNVCEQSMVGIGSPYNGNLGNKCLVKDGNSIQISVCVGEHTWEKYSDLTYGDRYLVLSEEVFRANEPCIYEYVEGTGNLGEHSDFSRYSLEEETTIFDENSGTLYYYDGASLIILSEKSAETSAAVSKNKFNDIVIVESIANEPKDGTQYIVGDSPTGDFASAITGQIANFDGTAWTFTTPKAGKIEVLNLQTKEILKFNGTKWLPKLTPPDEFIIVQGIATKQDGDWNRKNKLQDTYTINDTGVFSIRKPVKGEKFVYSEDDTNFYLLEVVDSSRGVIPEGSSWTAVKEQSVMPNNTIFYSITNRSFYQIRTYIIGSGAKHKFLARLENSKTYVVDYMFDWLGVESQWKNTTEVSEGYERLLTASYNYDGDEGRVHSEILRNNKWWKYDSYEENKIFTARATGYNNEKIIVKFGSATPEVGNNIGYINWKNYFKGYLYYERLYRGDIVINKADGITYVFNGTDFIPKIETHDVLPKFFTDVVSSAGETLPETAEIGDKFLKTDEEKIFTATAENTWNDGVEVNRDKDVFISKSDFKIYKNKTIYDSNAYGEIIDDKPIYIFFPLRLTIPKGYMFLNETDGNMYYFNGSEIKGVVSN